MSGPIVEDVPETEEDEGLVVIAWGSRTWGGGNGGGDHTPSVLGPSLLDKLIAWESASVMALAAYSFNAVGVGGVFLARYRMSAVVAGGWLAGSWVYADAALDAMAAYFKEAMDPPRSDYRKPVMLERKHRPPMPADTPIAALMLVEMLSEVAMLTNGIVEASECAQGATLAEDLWWAKLHRSTETQLRQIRSSVEAILFPLLGVEQSEIRLNRPPATRLMHLLARPVKQ